VKIRLHPIKSLDPVSVEQARIGPAGGLELDRAWALFSVDGRWVNGKRTAAMQLIRSVFSPDLSAVTLSVPGDRRSIPARNFAFPQDTESAAEWFSVYFERQIIVRYSAAGFPDDTLASGPTIVSTASLEAICTWFPGIDLEEARRRFRTTLELDAPESLELAAKTLPPFWEDRLFAEDDRSAVRFRIGEVQFEGGNPCARCPVPARDSYTGRETSVSSAHEPNNSFQKYFSERRRATLPAWSPASRFDHFYRLATNTRVAAAESGKLLRLGDPLTFST
jgi:hypothetical protein